MTYPKAFEKWFSKNLADRGIIDYGKGEELLKHFSFESWCAASKHLEGYIKRLDKGARIYDGSWQHEHTDWTLERCRDMRRIKK